MKLSLSFPRVMVIVLALSLLSGCGQSSGDSFGTKNESDAINGVAARQFYEGFLYRYDSSRPLPYRYLSSSTSKLKELGNGQNLYFNMAVFLHADGSFVLDYAESVGTISGGIISTTQVFQKRMTGKWTVEKNRLVLGEVGIGMGLQYNDENAVDFSFSQYFNEPTLLEKVALLNYVSSSQGE